MSTLASMGEFLMDDGDEGPKHDRRLLRQFFDVVAGDAKDIALDVAEVGLDACLEEGVVSDLPVVGIPGRLWNSFNKVRAAYQNKKLLEFLGPLDKVPSDKRKRMLDHLADGSNQEEIGERLFGIVDHVDTASRAKLLAHALVILIDEKINRKEFWRVAHVIKHLPLEDIRAIRDWREIEGDTVQQHIDAVRVQLYCSVGIMFYASGHPTGGIGYEWEDRLCTIFSDHLLTL